MAVTLKNTTSTGESFEVTYLPEKGMNMISFKKGNIEVIDQSTKNLFEERYAGLGALIGPHFHRRNASSVPKVKDESLFPHIARVKANGVLDPFSHGIARYAPWTAEVKGHSIKATLTGKDLWNGVPLAELEGQNFKMIFAADLLPDGLHIDYSIVSDTDSVIGLHYYYHLPKGKGVVTSSVQPQIIESQKKQPIPSFWNYNEQRQLVYPLDQETDVTFYPFPDPLNGSIHLDAEDYRLNVSYDCKSQENSWQLYHPQGASFVCIEPLSAQDPRHPNLTVSSLKVHIQIEAFP
jgi:hypothetical protein